MLTVFLADLRDSAAFDKLQRPQVLDSRSNLRSFFPIIHACRRFIEADDQLLALDTMNSISVIHMQTKIF